MCVYLTDVPISNVLLSAQSRCSCMYCNFSFDLRLLLCIVSKAYQARCCACVLINILFFPEFRVLTGIYLFFYLPSWRIKSTPSELLSLLEKQVIKEEKNGVKFWVYTGKEWFELLCFTLLFHSWCIAAAMGITGHNWRWVWTSVYTSLAFSGLVSCPGFKKPVKAHFIHKKRQKTQWFVSRLCPSPCYRITTHMEVKWLANWREIVVRGRDHKTRSPGYVTCFNHCLQLFCVELSNFMKTERFFLNLFQELTF